MSWKRGFIRIWVCLCIVWAAIVLLTFSREFSISHIQGGTYQYVEPTKTMPWETDWQASYYETHFAPGKGPEPDRFAILDSQYIPDWEKAVREGRIVHVAMPDDSQLYITAQLEKPDQELVARTFWQQRWNRYAIKLGKPLAILVAPPLLLLVVGFAFWWIGRGFRSPAPPVA